MTSKAKQGNELANASSPYLLQHAENPVHWRQWSKAALVEAEQLNKPILLSIGYAACHWCHVMAHESFENPEIAALMNELFVNIKVDREERPDIDQIYMAAVHAMGEQGGWPLTIFLTPQGKPFWGGTYFPPVPKFGRPGFPQILKALSHAYHHDQEKIASNSDNLQAYLSGLSQPADHQDMPPGDYLETLANRLMQIYDPVHGGIGTAPKFPNAPMLENLARAARTDPKSRFGDAFAHTLLKISNGGIYDHLAGGLARYSVDEKWLVPHFEKMLYDNGHYIRNLVWAWQFTGNDLFRRRIGETVAWIETEMLLEEGAFASSLDADSEGVEGKYYVWSHDEVNALLGEDAALFGEYYDVQPQGNWEGSTILNRTDSGSADEKTETRLTTLARTLYLAREQRIRPGLDDKILTDWNGYLIRALAEAGTIFRKATYRTLAANAFHFISESNSTELFHSWRKGQAVRPALATDYAAMINAALSLFEASGQSPYLGQAGKWIDKLEQDYTDGAGGFFLTSGKTDDLIVRPRCDSDEANPSAGSQILEAMVRYANLSQEVNWLDRAEKLAANMHAATQKNPHGISGLANGIDSLFNHVHIAILGTDPQGRRALERAVHQIPLISKTIRIHESGDDFHFGMALKPAEAPASAIVCSKNSCSAPLTSPEQLIDHLTRHGTGTSGTASVSDP